MRLSHLRVNSSDGPLRGRKPRPRRDPGFTPQTDISASACAPAPIVAASTAILVVLTSPPTGMGVYCGFVPRPPSANVLVGSDFADRDIVGMAEIPSEADMLPPRNRRLATRARHVGYCIGARIRTPDC